MKKALLILGLFLASLTCSAQFTEISRPSNPAPNFTLCGGPYVSFNFAEFIEPGAGVYVNMKDIFMVGPFYQYGIRNDNHLYGMYTHINFFPKEYYISVGLGARWGTYNMKQLTVEPMMIIHHNTRNDRMRFTHNIGIVGGWPSYSFGVIFGNFGEKWWKHPSKQYFSKNRIQTSMYYNGPKFQK